MAMETFGRIAVASLALCGSVSAFAAPPPTPTGLFVNPAPDAGGNPNKASAYVGWNAATGAADYIVRYRVNGGSVQQAPPSTTPTAFLGNLPAKASLSVTVAARNADGASAQSASVPATLPGTPTGYELDAYNRAADYSDARGGNAVVVLKHGRIVFTRYSNGYTGTGRLELASGTKSFSCAFAILAEQEGILNLNDRAAETISDWDGVEKKTDVTLLDLLSQQAGFTGNKYYDPSPKKVADLDTYALAVDNTASEPPGDAFIYDPLSFQAFALVFEVESGGTYKGKGQVLNGVAPLAYLQDRMFSKINVSNVAANWVTDVDGKPQMAGGSSLTPLEWLRYGQLVVQLGTWRSSRILNRTKLERCLGYLYDNDAYLGYGITWWINKRSTGSIDRDDRIPEDGLPAPGADRIAPSVPGDMAMAAGTGKQRLYVVPSLGLAVVRMGPVGTVDDWSDDEFLGTLIGSFD